MPGYRLAGVDKINLPEKFFCSHCSELLRDAVQTNCGHLYCESCLEQLSKNATTSFHCVKDGNVISNLKEQTFKDECMRREIFALTVDCTFKNEGCTWRGKVQHFEEHLRTYHACRRNFTLLDQDNVKHVNDAFRPDPNSSSVQRPRRETNMASGCPMSNELNNHAATSTCNFQCERLDNLRDAVDGILHAVENQVVQRDLQHRRLERRIESIERRQALTLADSQENVRQQESSSYDGQLLWKISDYARRRNDAVTEQQVSLYSPCFYTSRHGYKMCAGLYLNGDGKGRGTHISVFFVVMRGEYDALLRWPFRQKVTFMLLDQDNVEHVIDTFKPDPNSCSFERPRRETNIASGCPMFCSLDELNNHAYIRDDTMFIKVIVDITDL